MILAALAIKLTSIGPVLNKSIKVGKRGKLFSPLKFRIGKHSKNGHSSPISKKPHKLTWAGKYLESLKIEHLPTFINVLKGEMSIIGPNPQSLDFYASSGDRYTGLQKSKPGIFSPEIFMGSNGNYNDVREKKYSLQYFKYASFMNDTRLIANAVINQMLKPNKLLSLFGPSAWPKLFLLDAVLIILSFYFAYLLRFDGVIPASEIAAFKKSLPIVFITRIILFLLSNLYSTYYKYIAIKDLIRVVKAILWSSGAFIIFIYFLGITVHSRAIFIIDFILLVHFMAILRIALRLLSEKKSFDKYDAKTNVLIVGAGDVGELLVRNISTNSPDSRVVGFIDDDEKKIGKSIHGVMVYGNSEKIPLFVKSLHVDDILIAINKITAPQINNIINQCKSVKINPRIVPAIADLINGKIHIAKSRDINVNDIVGRDPLILDINAIEKFIQGKRILVTGAGGSIGGELVRQIYKLNPAQLFLIDRNENYLFDLQSSLKMQDDSSLIKTEFILLDILLEQKMDRLFKTAKPDIVFHAAAQKHVPISEFFPDEAVRTNVLGTNIVSNLAHKYAAKHFVFISTDKAVNPTSVMGATKRVCEHLLQDISKKSSTTFVTVRFGNVINSHGSVIPLFMKQIENGGPITITHKSIKRFFMSIPDAVNLVLQAVSFGKSGGIYVLNMGKLINITDLANNLVRQLGFRPGVDIEIKYTGLRPGEKLYEELVGKSEASENTAHPSIKMVAINGAGHLSNINDSLVALLNAAEIGDKDRIVPLLQAAVSEYQPPMSPWQGQRAEHDLFPEKLSAVN
jgi:FlaA1/EpsC-like NDP-sugar epimerase/lipopolysaccharide/colanic/teichoic acid biosynthesis glycosyltransferase